MSRYGGSGATPTRVDNNLASLRLRRLEAQEQAATARKALAKIREDTVRELRAGKGLGMQIVDMSLSIGLNRRTVRHYIEYGHAIPGRSNR